MADKCLSARWWIAQASVRYRTSPLYIAVNFGRFAPDLRWMPWSSPSETESCQRRSGGLKGPKKMLVPERSEILRAGERIARLIGSDKFRNQRGSTNNQAGKL